MKLGAVGLRGKFVVALVIAAALPLLVGVLVLHTIGFSYLVRERGRAHEAEARHFSGLLEQAMDGQAMSMRSWLAADDGLRRFVTQANAGLATRDPAEIEAETRVIEASWLGLSADDPAVRAVLDNVGAARLQEFVARHPLVAEVLATDAAGRIIAATRKSSDYDQSDEAWWIRGRQLPPDGAWSDSPHFDESAGVYSLDLALPIHEGDQPAGVVKMVLDATQLFGRIAAKRSHHDDDVGIALPDGRIMARLSEENYQPMSSTVDRDTMVYILAADSGASVATGRDGHEWMTGFSGFRSPGRSWKESPHGYVLISTRRDALVAPVRRQLLWVAAAAGLAVCLCAMAGFRFVSRRTLQPLKILGQVARAVSATARLRQGGEEAGPDAGASRTAAIRDLERIQEIRTGDEVEDLAGDLAVMTSRVLRYHREMEAEVAAKTAVIHEDLEMAREFQNALMPTEYPEVPTAGLASRLRLRFAHFYQPAAKVGGDFFDLIVFDDYRAGVLIADVMGHGARSALVTAIVQGLVRDRSGSAIEAGAFLGELNRHLHEVISRSGQVLFVTAFIIILDTRLARAEWAVAGHPSPLLGRRGDSAPPQPLWHKSPGQPALALLPDSVYQTERADLEAGDVFLLFTDGAVEAESPDGEEFGVERLTASFEAGLSSPLEAVPESIVRTLTAHLGGGHCDDDVCLVAIEAEAP